MAKDTRKTKKRIFMSYLPAIHLAYQSAIAFGVLAKGNHFVRLFATVDLHVGWG